MSKSKPKPPRPASTKKPVSAQPAKPAHNPTAKAKSEVAGGTKLGILDAAARVLKEKGAPMNCKAMVERMLSAKLWQSSGKTPAATLSSALLREIKDKGKESRFRKVDRGQFSLS